jgi:hypothetical protein
MIKAGCTRAELSINLHCVTILACLTAVSNIEVFSAIDRLNASGALQMAGAGERETFADDCEK